MVRSLADRTFQPSTGPQLPADLPAEGTARAPLEPVARAGAVEAVRAAELHAAAAERLQADRAFPGGGAAHRDLGSHFKFEAIIISSSGN